MNTKKEYDIAVSFAGEDRKIVEEIVTKLKNQNVKVFYDQDEQSSLWGEDLYSKLIDIYQNKATYCLMFCSQYYVKKLWTNHERKAAQARAFTESQAYILPIKLDNSEILGILNTIGYISYKNNSDEIVNLILEKLTALIFKNNLVKAQNITEYSVDENNLIPIEKLNLYLRNPLEWENQLGNEEIIYHKKYPEFTIEYLDSWEGKEIYSFFFPDENSIFYKYALKYHTTILAKEEVVSLDGGRYYLPTPQIGYIENNILHSVENKLTYYFYYDLSSLKGAFYLFLSHSIQKSPYKLFQQSILIFQNNKEKILFENSVKDNLHKVAEQVISENLQEHSDQIDKKQRNLCFNLATMIKLNQYKKQLFNE